MGEIRKPYSMSISAIKAWMAAQLFGRMFGLDKHMSSFHINSYERIHLLIKGGYVMGICISASLLESVTGSKITRLAYRSLGSASDWPQVIAS